MLRATDALQRALAGTAPLDDALMLAVGDDAARAAFLAAFGSRG